MNNGINSWTILVDYCVLAGGHSLKMAGVVRNFQCQFNCAMGCANIWLNIILWHSSWYLHQQLSRVSNLLKARYRDSMDPLII